MKKVEKGKPGYLNYKKESRDSPYSHLFCHCRSHLSAWIHPDAYPAQSDDGRGSSRLPPGIKALVGVIARFPYPSIDPDRAKAIAKISRHLTVCYDTVITSREKIMPADCFVISGHNLYGYTHYEKVNPEELAKHIRSILSQNGYTGLTVKILNQYAPFLARVEGLDNIAAVEQEDTKQTEQEIRQLLLNISM